jgi:hypothetical protein
MTKIDESLNVICPVCFAPPREVCKLSFGAPRFESHPARKKLFRMSQSDKELPKPAEPGSRDASE